MKNKQLHTTIHMKKIIFITLLLILTINYNVDAKSKQDSPSVNMVSYEQSWLDSEGTIALKNNTDEDIYNVSFVLEYLDMQGNPLDYETFSYNIDIAPGMTKKLDIPAYEHSRNYHYYKTKDNNGHPSFKLRYELKDYNSTSINPNNDSDITTSIVLTIFLILLFTLGIYIGLYVLVVIMSQRRNRNPAIWLLLSFIATPLLICIILLAIGKAHNDEY